MSDASYKQVTGKLDLISRQDAIEALDACCVKYNISPNYDDKRTNKEKFYDWWDMYKVLSMQIINDLPSAQPEERTKERAETHACDLISRQAAIDAIIGQPPEPHYPTWYAEQIKALPSAESEIIRCKDCRWWDKSEDSQFGYCMAMKHGYISANWEIGIYRRYKGDWYCADAERREYE